MKNIRVNNLGPIVKADIDFGVLTILVGPQASGKSIFLQFLKLLLDKKHIRKTLEQYGFPWKKDVTAISELYFGAGMKNIWNKDTQVSFNNKAYHSSFLLPRQKESITDASESVFFIPAHRVLSFENGWPRFFSAFDASVPYVLRHFSETLRVYMDKEIGATKDVFPARQRLKEPLRDAFASSIYQGATIKLDPSQTRKQFIQKINNTELPFMAWSTGQREFLPLLLSFYFLSPSSRSSRRGNFKIVIIEEPEMGLHPKAIQSILIEVMDLISRGYQIVISTHSPVFLEFAWAFRFLKESKKTSGKDLMKLFPSSPPSLSMMFENVFNQNIKSYYFDREGSEIIVRDISSLDAGSDDPAVSEWGGLSSFSTNAMEIVSKAVSL